MSNYLDNQLSSSLSSTSVSAIKVDFWSMIILCIDHSHHNNHFWELTVIIIIIQLSVSAKRINCNLVSLQWNVSWAMIIIRMIIVLGIINIIINQWSIMTFIALCWFPCFQGKTGEWASRVESPERRRHFCGENSFWTLWKKLFKH